MKNEEEARKYHLHINGDVGGNVVIGSDVSDSFDQLPPLPGSGAGRPAKIEAENEPDTLTALLAWCDRGNILDALEGYLEQAEAPRASLFCIAGHSENNQRKLLDRIAVELGEGQNGNTGKAVHIMSERSFDTVPAFAKAINKELGIKDAGALLAKLAEDRFDFQLLCHYSDCENWPVDKIINLLRTASAWLDGLSLASGPHRLILVLVFRFTVGKTALPWLDRLLRRAAPLQRIQQAYAAAAKPQGGLTARRIGELLVLDEFDIGHILRWLDLSRVRLALGDSRADELAAYAIKNQLKGGFLDVLELLQKTQKDRL